MAWQKRQRNNNSNKKKQQHQQPSALLCFRNSLSSYFRQNAMSSYNNVVLRRSSTRHHRFLRRRFFPLISLLLLIVLFFSFLSPPVPDSDHSPRRLAQELVDADQKNRAITDAVVAAYILNATLVVPMLDQKSYWKDASDFEDIFNVDWFISYVSKDVKIIKKLPAVGGKDLIPVRTRVPRKCSPTYYLNKILPLLNKKHAVQLTKFDYRLSNQLDMDLQKLRCRVNYHALRFTDPIQEMGSKLVKRMRMKSRHFIALHLRFESDMLAFSGCYYGGGEKERRELGAIKKRWKTLHKSDPDRQRRQGKCPLTPEEVGLMLRALGYNSDVHIYVASGDIYGGEEILAPLKKLFPNFHSKDTLASPDELAPFVPYSARMAALDFIVCDNSDVFVTNNNGNMAKILAGTRRYFGHKPTIRPNAKKLYPLFLNRDNMTWEEFSLGVRIHQVGSMGEPNEIKPGRGVFHENPTSCICENFSTKVRGDSYTYEQPTAMLQQHGKESSSTNYPANEVNDDYETDPPYLEDVDGENSTSSVKEIIAGISQGPGPVVTVDQPEFDEWLSD